ncbi:hypothetical protein ACVRWL_00405 [Streptococcus ratti]|uniref:Transcription initiation factor TFIIIB n=2 Tax=Streptococcus ratti TaxID=1341 RepID=A0A7X9QGX6_STRRT|nr:hypothetical protein [Streptococcus ratti]VEI60765.1 Uncharacterised protein [Streptococcus mutans]EJN94485.1 hypothetical protein SRA_08106 [Streptococcus ratti FA-1 = DSM 20564]EMP70369.1 hypothetical protein D822_04526 [Streptococcus ratti FA-1 = DSM 20564]NMD48942.1 hypothetical protein [Streptococcus ratti]QEY06422.1 hypothetical protein FY406_01395 [Streptococcus ratti]
MTTQTCPYCGGIQFVTAKQNKGYAGISRSGSATSLGQSICLEICKNCGTVVRFFVEHPEKLS